MVYYFLMLTEFWSDFLWINWTHNEHEYFKNFSGVLTHLEKPGPANPSESSLLITKHTFVYRELFWSYRSVKQIKWCLKDKFHFPGIHNCSWCFIASCFISFIVVDSTYFQALAYLHTQMQPCLSICVFTSQHENYSM